MKTGGDEISDSRKRARTEVTLEMDARQTSCWNLALLKTCQNVQRKDVVNGYEISFLAINLPGFIADLDLIVLYAKPRYLRASALEALLTFFGLQGAI